MQRRILVISRLLVALGLAATAAVAKTAAAAPFRPSDDAQVLERLPSAGSGTARELRELHTKLAQSPRDLALALRVAKRDIAVARGEGDPRYNGYAEAALGPWLKLPNPPNEVIVLRATLRQARHDFPDALADLSRALSEDPRNAQAWLTRAVILQVQGDYTKALGNCLSLARFAETLVTAICVDGVSSLSGRAATSYDDLQQVLDHAPPAENGEIRLWALTVLAEIATRLGDFDAAERHFKEALALNIRDVYLLGAYADFLLDRDRPREVRSLLEKEVRNDPLLLRLALAEQRLGAAELPGHIADLAERFAEARQRGDTVHQREEAWFTLHLLKQRRDALRLAEANWTVQREPRDARLLFEAALAADEPSAARPALDWFVISHVEDKHLGKLAGQLQQVAQ
jgi:tetratricopeptide (TPR) repeat protein